MASGITNTPGNIAINGGSQTIAGSVNGGSPGAQKDIKENPNDAKFGDVLKNLQTKYGAKAEKPREIKKTLGKDDFLRIMITQMRHQDPTAPFKPDEMAQQMAQFTSLEQLKNVNDNLDKMTRANQPMERLAMTNLIGKTVTVDKDRFAHLENQGEVVSFQLPRDAKHVKLTLIHESGETVLEKDLGSQKAGNVDFQWDGLKGNTLPAKAGNYIMKVEAKDDQDKTITTNGQAHARVIGVSFEGSEPFFLVGDGKSQTKVSMKNIVKIEDQGGAPVAQPATGGAQGAAAGQGTGAPSAAPAGGNFISFQKGVGSSNLDPSALAPEAQAAIARFQQGQTTAQQASAQGAHPANAAADAAKNAANFSGNSAKK